MAVIAVRCKCYAEVNGVEGPAGGFARYANKAVRDDDGATNGVGVHMGDDTFDRRATGGTANTTAKFLKADVVNLGREKVDARVHQMTAFEDGAIQSVFQIRDAAADIEVDVNWLDGLAAGPDDLLRVQKRRDSKRAQDDGSSVVCGERRDERGGRGLPASTRTRAGVGDAAKKRAEPLAV